MRRVLITGKTSFIGGRLAALLREHPEQYAVDQVSVRDGGEDVGAEAPRIDPQARDDVEALGEMVG